MVARLLQCIAVVAHVFGNHAQAYYPRLSSVYGVAESDRVSPEQLFTRDVDIVQTSYSPYVDLLVYAPGRVFVTFLENPTAIAQGIIREIKVSGSSKAAVGNVSFKRSVAFPEEIQISVTTFQPNRESMLIEVQLYKKNFLKRVRMQGTGELVIMEIALHAPHTRAEWDRSSINASVSIDFDDGNIFVHDPSAEFTTEFFEISNLGDGNATIQIELAKLNITGGDLNIFLKKETNLALFVDQLIPLNVVYTSNTSEAHNGLCVSTKSSVNMTSRNWDQEDIDKTRMLPSGASCVNRSLPERVPALIRLPTGRRKGSDYAPAAATVVTPAPGAKSAAITTEWSATVTACGLVAMILTASKPATVI